MVHTAAYPGSTLIPAPRAVLSLLALKLLDKERKSHINDFNFDEAVALFAGLNVLPKKSYATRYSYSTGRANHEKLLTGWVRGLSKLLFPEGNMFSVDFHPIPFRGDPTGMDRHYLPRQGKASPSVLTFFALEQESRVVCYSNANLTRGDQPGALLQFVAYWHDLSGRDPEWVYFDSKLAPYQALSTINQRGIWFVTIRRRGARLLQRLRELPASTWHRAVIDTPKRCHQKIRYVDETIHLPDYKGPLRQVAVEGLGREAPTLFLSNNFTETPRSLIVRYAGRNRMEDGIGISVNFFHLDCLASAVRLNVDLDTTLTVLANGCYRWLATHLHGFEKAAPKQLYRKFVETAGTVEIQKRRLIVHFEKRCHNPLLREAALDQDCPRIPWLPNHSLVFRYP